MKRTMLKKKSAKQIIRDSIWHRIAIARILFLVAKYGVALCEYCGRPSWGNELGNFDPHHIDRNRRNNTEDNCYICHRVCHSHITLNKLNVKQLGFEGVIKGGNDE